MEWLEMAKCQAGMVSGRQIRAAGVSDFRRNKLVAAGSIEEVDDGIFRLPGSPSGWDQACWVALLQCGTGAFLYRRTAARLWNFDAMNGSPIEVAVPASKRPRRVKVPRLSNLLPEDVCIEQGFPVTAPSRTLVDLDPVLDPERLERALESALRLGLVDADLLSARIRAGRGSGRLRKILAGRPPAYPPTESDAESLFSIISRGMGLPPPRRQYVAILAGRKYRIDFAWPEIRLAVEIDGVHVHGPTAFDRDIARQNQIVLDGWLILRFGWYALTRQRRSIERDLFAAWSLRTASAGLWRQTAGGN